MRTWCYEFFVIRYHTHTNFIMDDNRPFSLCRYHGTDRFSTYLQSRFNRRLFPFLGQISRTECEETIETSEVWKYVVFPWPFWVEDLGTRERTQEPIIVLSSQFDNVFGGFSYGNSDGPSLECDEYFTYFEHDGGIRSFDGWILIVCVRFFILCPYAISVRSLHLFSKLRLHTYRGCDSVPIKNRDFIKFSIAIEFFHANSENTNFTIFVKYAFFFHPEKKTFFSFYKNVRIYLCVAILILILFFVLRSYLCDSLLFSFIVSIVHVCNKQC